MFIVNLFIGAVLLIFGRRLFWLFVAAAGFAAGLFLARDYFEVDSEYLTLAIALLAGVVGALLAVFLQKLAIGIAGFIAGGYLLAALFQVLGAPSYAWLGVLIGGIAGALLLLAIFEWGLIALSSLLGAALIADAAPVDEEAAFIIFLVALILGVIAQSLQLKRTREVERPARAQSSQ